MRHVLGVVGPRLSPSLLRCDREPGRNSKIAPHRCTRVSAGRSPGTRTLANHMPRGGAAVCFSSALPGRKCHRAASSRYASSSSASAERRPISAASVCRDENTSAPIAPGTIFCGPGCDGSMIRLKKLGPQIRACSLPQIPDESLLLPPLLGRLKDIHATPEHPLPAFYFLYHACTMIDLSPLVSLTIVHPHSSLHHSRDPNPLLPALLRGRRPGILRRSAISARKLPRHFDPREERVRRTARHNFSTRGYAGARFVQVVRHSGHLWGVGARGGIADVFSGVDHFVAALSDDVRMRGSWVGGMTRMRTVGFSCSGGS